MLGQLPGLLVTPIWRAFFNCDENTISYPGLCIGRCNYKNKSNFSLCDSYDWRSRRYLLWLKKQDAYLQLETPFIIDLEKNKFSVVVSRRSFSESPTAVVRTCFSSHGWDIIYRNYNTKQICRTKNDPDLTFRINRFIQLHFLRMSITIQRATLCTRIVRIITCSWENERAIL